MCAFGPVYAICFHLNILYGTINSTACNNKTPYKNNLQGDLLFLSPSSSLTPLASKVISRSQKKCVNFSGIDSMFFPVSISCFTGVAVASQHENQVKMVPSLVDYQFPLSPTCSADCT